MRFFPFTAGLALLLAACAPAAPPTATRPAVQAAATAAPVATISATPPAATAAPATPAATPTTAAPTPVPTATRPPAGAPPTPTAASAAATAAPTRPAQASGAPAPTATGPRGPAVRVGTASAQRVVAAPGAISYAVAPSGIYRLEAGAASLIEGTPGGVELVALGDGKLVTGLASGCMIDGRTAPLRYSRDGGRSWADALGPTGRGFQASPRRGRGDEVFAVYCGGVLWSADGGRTFAAVPPLSPPNFEPRDLALSPDGATAYVSAVSEGGTLQVYRATKAGAAWGAAAKIDEGWGIGALAVGTDGRLYLGTVRGVKSSVDRGSTWQAVARAGLEEELISGDPAEGNLSAVDERKMRAGVGVNDLAFLGSDLIAATQHGLYRLAGDRWARWSDVAGRVDRLVVDDGALYATMANGVVRLPAS
jgi:hypothetical protein